MLCLSACDRSKNPILSIPDAGSTAIKVECPQVENSRFPECRAYVLITNQADQPITDFRIGNFTILENGGPSVVTAAGKVNNSEDPLSVVMCLDRSGSMSSDTAALNDAAKQFIDLLGVNDAAEIIDFSSEVKITQSFTTDKTLLKQKIDEPPEYGATALYDAVGLAAKELKSRSGRKFILAMTDGYENASNEYTTTTSVADAVNKGGIAAYIVGLGSYIDTASLQFITSSTGGRYYNSPTSAQLAAYFAQILNLMQNLVKVDFRTRLDNSVRELGVYLNYGNFAVSTKRKYGY